MVQAECASRGEVCRSGHTAAPSRRSSPFFPHLPLTGNVAEREQAGPFRFVRGAPYVYRPTTWPAPAGVRTEFPMVQVLEQTADPETMPAIEATLNYVKNTGEKLFTYTGGPGLARRAHRRHGRPAAR